MSGVNKVILFGQIKGKPRYEESSNNQCILLFELTTIDKRFEHIENHHVVMNNHIALSALNILFEDMMVYLEGRLNTTFSYDDNNVRHYRTVVQCSNFQII